MATVPNPLSMGAAEYLTTAFPQLIQGGANFPETGLAFDDAANEAAFWKIDVSRYAGLLIPNLTLVLDWRGVSSTSGSVVWGAAIAAITPDTDGVNPRTKALAGEQTVADAHLGNLAERVMRCTLAISNLDDVVAGDLVWLRIRRLSAGNSYTGDAVLLGANLQYSDT